VRRREIIHVHVCKEHGERADHSSVEKAKHRQDMTSFRVTGSSNNIWFLTLSKEAYFNTLFVQQHMVWDVRGSHHPN
jgi:hypothetical protein